MARVRTYVTRTLSMRYCARFSGQTRVRDYGGTHFTNTADYTNVRKKKSARFVNVSDFFFLFLVQNFTYIPRIHAGPCLSREIVFVLRQTRFCPRSLGSARATGAAENYFGRYITGNISIRKKENRPFFLFPLPLRRGVVCVRSRLKVSVYGV